MECMKKNKKMDAQLLIEIGIACVLTYIIMKVALYLYSWIINFIAWIGKMIIIVGVVLFFVHLVYSLKMRTVIKYLLIMGRCIMGMDFTNLAKTTQSLIKFIELYK